MTAERGQGVRSESRMLWLLCVAAFWVFVQTFMVAPIIPRLAAVFTASIGIVALAVPAYVLPEGLTTLASGPLSDRFGRRRVILGSLLLFSVLTAATGFVDRAGNFIFLRILTGIAAAGVVPIGLTLIGDVVPFARRGKAVGWLFGAIAGGTATGAAAGALLEPLIGWRALFWVVAALSFLAFLGALLWDALPRLPLPDLRASLRDVLGDYRHILSAPRARHTYGYVLLNAVLISGVFTWIGVYLHRRFDLGELQIGLTLLGYGVPGLLFGPVIGKLSDRYGRRYIIPSGLGVTAVCALMLALPLPLNGARIAIVLLSLGFDLTHPQLAAISTNLDGPRGQTVALMAFCLFGGFGLGSLLFQAALVLGFTGALLLFAGVALIGAAYGLHVFRDERPRGAAH